MHVKSLNTPINLKNGHIETLIPFIFRPSPKVSYVRERIKTFDDDFLDLDWSRLHSSKDLVILNHGLESSSDAHYIKGMVKQFNKLGMDCLAWNYRGCSGEMNKTIKFYHSGATYDLDEVVKHVTKTHSYKNIYIVGFSLGANLALKYLGEGLYPSAEKITAACVFSAPCCLESSSLNLQRGFNQLYTQIFLMTMRKKLIAKKYLLKNAGFSLDNLFKIKTLKEFDDRFTAPLHGMKDAKDYYNKNSAKCYISKINKPTLIINSLNDPFLTKECHPTEIVYKNPKVNFELKDSGGHVGFMKFTLSNVLWSELRAVEFISSLSH